MKSKSGVRVKTQNNKVRNCNEKLEARYQIKQDRMARLARLCLAGVPLHVIQRKRRGRAKSGQRRKPRQI